MLLVVLACRYDDGVRADSSFVAPLSLGRAIPSPPCLVGWYHPIFEYTRIFSPFMLINGAGGGGADVLFLSEHKSLHSTSARRLNSKDMTLQN